MRRSRVLKDNRSGRCASCAKLNLSDPRIVEIFGLAGVSVVWLCQEHVPLDWTNLEDMTRAARLHDMDMIIRVSKGAYSDYIKPFEAGATGVMVPNVESAEEARQIVQWTKFRPIGCRPLDGGNTDAEFTRMPLADYVRQSNENQFVILQIESPEAVEKIDEIAAVPGYDFLLFGMGDYSHKIDRTGQFQHPEVEKARLRVERGAAKHGKKMVKLMAQGTMEDLYAQGYGIAHLGSDVGALTAFARRIMENPLEPTVR